jgi:hypothetical protein
VIEIRKRKTLKVLNWQDEKTVTKWEEMELTNMSRF